MTTEEKAKAYDKIIERAQEMIFMCGSGTDSIRKTIESIIPQLKESEDERMRRVLTEGFAILNKNDVWYDGVTVGQILAWFKKQSKNGTNRNNREIPNSTLSEEDKRELNRIYSILGQDPCFQHNL